MTNDEVIRRMTKALRSLNKTKEAIEKNNEVQKAQSPINFGCPICDTARKIITADLEDIEEKKEWLITKTQADSVEEKLIAAVKIETYCEETEKHYWLMSIFLDVSHDLVGGIIDSKVMEVDPDDFPEFKKKIKQMMRDGVIPMPFNRGFDPDKAN